jgi:hypothetical protein
MWVILTPETAQCPGFSDPVEMNQGLGSLSNPDQYVGALDQIHNWDMVGSWNWTYCLKKEIKILMRIFRALAIQIRQSAFQCSDEGFAFHSFLPNL